jgi:hypothetical protein
MVTGTHITWGWSFYDHKCNNILPMATRHLTTTWCHHLHYSQSCWFTCRRFDGLIAGTGHSLPPLVPVQLPESHRLLKQSSTTALQHGVGPFTAWQSSLRANRVPASCQVSKYPHQLEAMTGMIDSSKCAVPLRKVMSACECIILICVLSVTSHVSSLKLLILPEGHISLSDF